MSSVIRKIYSQILLRGCESVAIVLSQARSKWDPLFHNCPLHSFMCYVLLKQCHCEFFHDSWCKNILFLLRLTCLHYTSVSIDNCAQVRFKPMTGISECMECYIHRIIVEETVLTLLTMIALR